MLSFKSSNQVVGVEAMEEVGGRKGGGGNRVGKLRGRGI